MSDDALDNDAKVVDESDKSKTEMDKRSLDQKGDMATMTGLYFKKHHIKISQ